MELPWLPSDAEIKITPGRRGDDNFDDDPVLQFRPYATYRANETRLHEFVVLTSISYQLAQQLLFAKGREQLPEVVVGEPNPKEWSYSMADVVAKPEVVVGWLRYWEYAEHAETTPEEVQRRAEAGELGPIKTHPSDGAPVILWPPPDQRDAEFEEPEPGRYKVAVASFTVSVAAESDHQFDLGDPSQFEEAQSYFLRLAHAMGEPSEVSSRAEAILFRAALLLQWTSFETFVRETVETLLAEHPSVIPESAGKKASISYDELFTMSTGLSSIDDLRRELIEIEVQRLRAGGRSVHGLINFLKSAFRFDADPYEAWYVLIGERRQASYQTLMGIKERRNGLVHGGPSHGEGSAEKPATENEYLDSGLALQAIAYSIARSVQSGRYRPAGPDEADSIK
jgi:hypothetical protein